MSKMRRLLSLRLLSISAAVLLLAGCHHPDSYNYLTTHPKELEQLLRNCNAMPISQASQDVDCLTAENARQEVTALLSGIQNNTQEQAFGQKIIAAQVKLVDLKSEYQRQASPKLAAAIQDQQDYVARLLAICAYIGE